MGGGRSTHGTVDKFVENFDSRNREEETTLEM